MYEVSVYQFFSLNHNYEILFQAYYLPLLIHPYMFLTTTNGQEKSIAALNNRTVPLITDDFLLFATKIYVLKAV